MIDYDLYVRQNATDNSVQTATPVGLTAKSVFALELAQQLAVYGVKAAGVDSTGRPKLYPLNAQDVVTKAMQVTDLLFPELELRGEVQQLPNPFI